MANWFCGNIDVIILVFALLSFLVKSERKIRLLNMLMCVVFGVYAIITTKFLILFLSMLLLSVHVRRIQVIEEQARYLRAKMGRTKIGSVYTHDNKYIKTIDEEDNSK